MRGHLEDAIGGRVHDRLAGADVFLAQLLDDLGAGRRAIRQRAAPDAALELLHDLWWESVRIERKRLGEMDARHFPMPGGSVLARRCERTAAVCGGWMRGWFDIPKRLNIAQSQLRQVRQAQRAFTGDVAQRVAAHVAVCRRVRHRADADAVQHDPGNAAEPPAGHCFSGPASGGPTGAPRASFMRSDNMSTKRSGTYPTIRLTMSPFLPKIIVVGILETCSSAERPSSK